MKLLKRFLANTLQSELFNRISLSTKRDMYSILGYEKDLTVFKFWNLYDRSPVAKRVVDGYPDACWNSSLVVNEDGDNETDTAFEKAFNSLSDKHSLFSIFNSADKLARIGHYSIIVIGTAGTGDLETPLEKLNSVDDILYLQPYAEDDAEVIAIETDSEKVNCGLPTLYSIKQITLRGQVNIIKVHASRVLHIAEGLLKNKVIGTPALQAVYNRIIDMEKVQGGSSEIYWYNARGVVNLNMKGQGDITEEEEKKIKEHTEKFWDGLDRTLRTQDVDVKPIQLNHSSPKDTDAILWNAVACGSGYPKRYLQGTEQGQLAGSQDENNWLRRIAERRDIFCERMVLRPFIAKLVQLGALPKVDKYNIDWKPLSSLSETDASEVAVKKSKALTDYVNSNGAELVVPEKQFVEEILNIEYKEEAIKKAKKEEDDFIKELDNEDKDA